MRRASTLLLIALVLLGAAGWVRLLISLDRVERHERMLSRHIGAIVDHERRLQNLERALGQDPAGRRHPTLGDLVCSDASRTKRPMLGDRL